MAGDVGERVAQVMTSERDLVHDTTSLTILALLPLRTLSLAYLPSNRLSFTNNGVIANRVRCVRVRVRVRSRDAVERGICRMGHCSQRHTCGATVCYVLTSARPGTSPVRSCRSRVPGVACALCRAPNAFQCLTSDNAAQRGRRDTGEAGDEFGGGHHRGDRLVALPRPHRRRPPPAALVPSPQVRCIAQQPLQNRPNANL